MSPRFGRSPGDADHARARELAAARLAEDLAAPDAAFLDAHLHACEACRGVAAEYETQRLSLRSLRSITPVAPRDLWARTAAALESEARHGPARRRRFFSNPPPRLARAGRLALAPLAVVMVIAIAVGAGLFNGYGFPPGSTPAGPTPIALTAADLQVISRGDDGSMQILTRSVNAVCPVGTAACGVSPSFAVTAVTGLSGSADLNGILSPAKDRMIVVEHGTGAQGVYVVPVATPTPKSPSTAEPSTSASLPTPTGTANPATTAPASVLPATPTPEPSGTPATATPTPAGPSDEPSPSLTPGTDASASAPPSASIEPASPSPSVEVSPAAGGAIEIASGVTVVGSAAYSPDGTRFAFSARPSDGSTGPDVYVWTVGQAHAVAVTTDHATQFAAWTAAGLLVSRITDGTPGSALLDPGTGVLTPVGQGAVWLPVVDPSGRSAAWWQGTVKLAPDGVRWLPDAGRLVLGAWPPVATDVPQVLADGPLSSWELRWDETGTVLAVWLEGADPGKPGRLSLYPVDAATGRADLAQPMLDAVPAAQGFSLKNGRLAWAVLGDGGGGTVHVLAWTGSFLGQLEMPAEQGSTVVP